MTIILHVTVLIRYAYVLALKHARTKIEPNQIQAWPKVSDKPHAPKLRITMKYTHNIIAEQQEEEEEKKKLIAIILDKSSGGGRNHKPEP